MLARKGRPIRGSRVIHTQSASARYAGAEMENDMDTTNLDIAIEAIQSEQGTPVAREHLAGYVAKINALADAVRELRAPHARAIASAADKASREKRAARVKAGLALLEAQERGELVAA